MALNAHQKIVADDVNYRLNSVEVRGVVCSVSATAGECEVAANPSGTKVAGILLMDVVLAGRPANLDSDSSLDTGTSSTQRNLNKNETFKGGVVRLARKGELVTDQCTGSIAAGDTLYLAASGIVSATQATGAQEIGFAIDAKDGDGFIKMFLDC